MKFLIFSILIVLSVKTPAEEDHYYHYIGESNYFIASDDKRCLIDFGQPLEIGAPGPQDGLVMCKIIQTEEGECSGEMITLPEELVSKGILSIGGLSMNDLEALTANQLNDRPRDKNDDRFRGHAYYIGEEASVKLVDEDARNCIICSSYYMI